jgi:hypothetical protein
MESRDRGIAVQVAFKGAIDLAVKGDYDLTSPEGQAMFEQTFGYLTESIIVSIEAAQTVAVQHAHRVQGEFPGSTLVDTGPGPFDDGGEQPAVTIKGAVHGPIPTWLIDAAKAKGVTEVYDNRDRAAGTNRPHFKSTSGGDQAPAFWPPNSYKR